MIAVLAVWMRRGVLLVSGRVSIDLVNSEWLMRCCRVCGGLSVDAGVLEGWMGGWMDGWSEAWWGGEAVGG